MLIVVAACGSDGESTTESTTEPSAASVTSPDSGDTDDTDDTDDSAFCAAATEINNLDGFPTVEDITAYQAVAPESVQAPIQVVLDALDAAGGDFQAVFSDQAAGEALEEITAIEEATCGSDGEESAADPSVTVVDPQAVRVDVSATEYDFAADLPSASGRYSFVMSNDGAEPHVMILVRLEEDATLEAVLESQGETGVAEEYESSGATPGDEGVLTADLGAGNWVLLCPIPGTEGRPHFADGMIEEFTVG